MTPQLWIGLGFTAALVLFLMVAFFIGGRPDQYNTLRFLTALCGAFAGGFLAGDALFRWEQQLPPGTKILVSGTAGCALFFAVWFTYPKKPEEKILEQRFVLSIPQGWTFEQAARGIVKVARGIAHFQGFRSTQLRMPLPAIEIDAETGIDALKQLRYQCPQLPDYRVEFKNGVYHINA